MLQLLGLKPEEIQRLIAELQEALKALKGEMACMKASLEAVERILGYEYGRPSRALMGHDPLRLPLIAQVEAAGEAKRVDVAGLLGKPATRGHVVNIGDAKAALWFETGAQRVGPYYLLPAAALDLSWALEILEVRDTGEGPAKVQILMQ
jgi:hypothetical protein